MGMLGVASDDRDHPSFGRPEDTLRELEKTRWGGARGRLGCTVGQGKDRGPGCQGVAKL
jgi:hypothetical protein